jgi:YGGT family
MRNNPYPDEPKRAQPADVLSPRERMEDLPSRPVAPQPVAPPAVIDGSSNVENVEIRQEEARTVRYAIGKLNDFLQWFLVVMEVTLAIRFFLMLIGALPSNLFAGFLYSLTDIVLIPFANIVSPLVIHGGQEFEWSTIIAMLIYWLIFWAVRRFLSILISVPEESVS